MALEDTAVRLIEKRGRSVVLVRSAAAPSEPSKPWRGAGAPAGTRPGDVRVPLKAVFTSAKQEPLRVLLSDVATDEGDTSGKKRLLIAAKAAAALTAEDLTTFDFVEELDGSRWSIDGGELVKPGETAYLYDLQVSQ